MSEALRWGGWQALGRSLEVKTGGPGRRPKCFVSAPWVGGWLVRSPLDVARDDVHQLSPCEAFEAFGDSPLGVARDDVHPALLGF